jgi:Skp family chaperone for outer membrane proteins
MNLKTYVIALLTASVIFVCGYEHIQAESENTALPGQIGIVSIQKVFEKCKRNEEYIREIEAERQDIVARLDTLEKEIDAARSGLKTLKKGSDDRLERVKQLLEKEAKLQAQKEFYQQKLELKNQTWTEELYRDVLETVTEIARQKKLELVLEDSSVSLPANNTNELMLSIRTNKVLYSQGCIDITEDVIQRIDK